MLKGIRRKEFWENIRDLQQHFFQSSATKKQQADKERLQRDEGGLKVKRNISESERECVCSSFLLTRVSVKCLMFGELCQKQWLSSSLKLHPAENWQRSRERGMNEWMNTGKNFNDRELWISGANLEIESGESRKCTKWKNWTRGAAVQAVAVVIAAVYYLPWCLRPATLTLMHNSMLVAHTQQTLCPPLPA